MLIRQINWFGGWGLVLLAFVTGAGIGLFFHHDNFLGGYTSWSRRMLRLGHIAMAALGILNVVYSLAPIAGPAAGLTLLAGAIAMPALCFASAWKQPLRVFFFIPVSLLAIAVILILTSGAHP